MDISCSDVPTKENTTPSECALLQLPNETTFAVLLASDPEDVLFGLEKVLNHIVRNLTS